ncbi:MAG: threonylcarbamoyl-AMP synthase [Muribaculaceae bacterium]|nr:threonylcarbamoyl-AMP synthase [Muribaculaceae bacterium]
MTDYSDDIAAAVEHLKKGGIILYPTDTVWGLGCDATNDRAVARIFEIKRRSDSKALITLVGSIDQLLRTAEDVPDVALQLIEYSERPVTIVYDSPLASAHLAPALLADDGSIGIRVTAESFSSQLCRAFRRPLVSTSANVSGQPTPMCFAEISDDIRNAVDYICQSRRAEGPAAAPSTVIRLHSDGRFKLIRP